MAIVDLIASADLAAINAILTPNAILVAGPGLTYRTARCSDASNPVPK